MPSLPAVYAAATFFSTLAGGFFALRFSTWMDRIMAFSGGLLLAAGLLDLLPEAVALNIQHAAPPALHPAIYSPLLCAVAGFILFYLVERMAILRSYHSHHHHPEQIHPAHVEGTTAGSGDGSRRSVGILGAAGLCIHSLLDGFSIGVAFHASAAVGTLVSVAIIGHDFSDGVSTVTLLISNQNSRAASVAWLILDAAAPLFGAGLATFLTLSSPHLGDLLGGFAGMFLYLGATHMLPEAHALSDSWGTVAWTLAGVGLMVAVTHWIG